MEQARHKAYGVSDVRYKLHDASFSTLLLQVATLLQQIPPVFCLTSRSNAHKATRARDGTSNTAGATNDNTHKATKARDGASNTTKAGDGVALREEVAENNVDDGDAESIIDGDYHHNSGATYEGPTSKAAQEQ